MFNQFSGLNCCGMDELSGFDSLEKGPWIRDLYIVAEESYGTTRLPPIIVFSGANYQNRGKTPFAFARWLRNQGETVVNTPKVRNPNSGSIIQAFLWAPSKEFRKKFASFIQKEEEKEDKNESKPIAPILQNL